MLRSSSQLELIACLWLVSWTANAQEVRFTEGRAAMANPERGFYAPRMSNQVAGLDRLRAAGITLILVEMDLREFKEREISPEKLDELRRAFHAAREHGLKVIFRAAYGFTDQDYRADPRDLGRITGHIRQLGTILKEERDVLYSVQAGLLGPWGEWHGSNHGDPPTLEARRAVLFGWLDAVPCPVQVRRPMFIRDLLPGKVTAGSPLSRVGWHDDALLSLPTDLGTFAERGWDRERELRWSADHGLYAPFGGETVPSSAKTPIAQVIRELERFRATYINSAYHRGTLEGWRQANDQGENAYAQIERRLGYRLVADRLSSKVEPGGAIKIDLDLRNVGFAPPYLPRVVALVLSRGDARHRVVAAADPRRWLPGEPIHVNCELRLPKDAPRGRWSLSLHLADPSPRLRDDGRYAIRLSNENIRFDDRTGFNLLVEEVEMK